MMDFFKRFIGPEIYVILKDGSHRHYQPNFGENIGGRIISSIKTCVQISAYLSPFILTYCYRCGLLHSFHTVQKYGPWLMLLYGIAFTVRGLSRNLNQEYVQFWSILNKVKQDAEKNAWKKYDFDFSQWPVDYEWSSDNVKQRRFIKNDHEEKARTSVLPLAVRKYLASAVASSIGRRMIYPGTLQIVQSMVWPQLLQGRIKLINEFGAQRYKLLSSRKDSIDAIFIDRRNDVHYPRGNTLMVTCEGNAGFYESGLVTTALDAGYSVLGWNHPGFAGSSGLPWPENECAAADVVMQFASKRLGFAPHDTIIMAWSIGGFSASWLGMNYPDIRGLVLDAVFDDVLPLARHAMSPALAPIVDDVIKMHFNLHIGEQIKQYGGPVSFFRRSLEEIIVTDTSSPQNQRKSNRINFLLVDFLRYRYPYIFDRDNEQLVMDWIVKTSLERSVDKSGKYASADCVNLLTNYFGQPNLTAAAGRFPTDFGLTLDRTDKNSMAFYLVDFYFDDFEATHCVPLPGSLLRIPYHPWDVVLNN